MNRVDAFYRQLLRGPWWVVGVIALLLALSLSQLPNLRLDASSDSLLLQGDPDLAYFRESSAKYAGLSLIHI